MSDSTIPRRPPEIIESLLKLAGIVIDKPFVAFGHLDAINHVLAEIRDERKRPTDRERIIDDLTEWLAQSLRHVAEATGPISGGSRDVWLRAAIFFTPIVTEQCRKAHEAELFVPTSDGADMGRYR